MTSKLFPLGLNELLDFVRRGLSFSPEPSRLILPLNLSNAAWRFIFEYNRFSMLERAQSIQATSSFNYSCASQDSRRLIDAFEPTIQQESNARINPPGDTCIVRQVLDERPAHSGRVQWVVRLRPLMKLHCLEYLFLIVNGGTLKNSFVSLRGRIIWGADAIWFCSGHGLKTIAWSRFFGGTITMILKSISLDGVMIPILYCPHDLLLALFADLPWALTSTLKASTKTTKEKVRYFMLRFSSLS